MEYTLSERRTRQILIWLGTAARRLNNRVNRALEGGELPYAQFVVLNHLASLPGQSWTVSALAAALETGQPAVTKILQRLIAKGFVQAKRDPDDHRRRHHQLTPAGESAYRVAAERLAPESGAVFSTWSDHDIETLHALLHRLKDTL